MVYLPLGWATISEESKRDSALTVWMEYCGNKRREYRNSLASAVPDYMPTGTLNSMA